MAPSLRTVAVEVVRRAELQPASECWMSGCGTGIAAAAAHATAPQVVGVDGAPGMIAIARREVPDASFLVGDFDKLPFDDGAFDVVIRSTRCSSPTARWPPCVSGGASCTAGGRLSLSVPGPAELTPICHLRRGLPSPRREPPASPTRPPRRSPMGAQRRLDRCGRRPDPSVAIRLPDPEAFAQLAPHRRARRCDRGLERGAARGPDRGHAGGHAARPGRRLRHPVRGALPHRPELSPRPRGGGQALAGVLDAGAREREHRADRMVDPRPRSRPTGRASGPRPRGARRRAPRPSRRRSGHRSAAAGPARWPSGRAGPAASRRLPGRRRPGA